MIWKWNKESPVFCSQCGAQLEPDAAFCSKCGVKAVERAEAEDQPTVDAILTQPKAPKLVGKRFLVALSWFFWVLTVVNIAFTIASGRKPPWNHEFFFAILCGTLIAVYVPRGRLFAFVGGFILSVPLVGLIGRLAKALA
jgi:hypothetical protein